MSSPFKTIELFPYPLKTAQFELTQGSVDINELYSVLELNIHLQVQITPGTRPVFWKPTHHSLLHHPIYSHCQPHLLYNKTKATGKLHALLCDNSIQLLEALFLL